MRKLGTRLFVKAHDWRLQQQLHRDEEGLTILAYALGAAFIVIPLAVLMLTFGTKAADHAQSSLDDLIAASVPTPP